MRKTHKKIKNDSKAKEYRRKLSIRKKVNGTAERPRVCTTKSNKNLFVQVVDDVSGTTLFSVQTYGKSAVAEGANTESAKAVGAAVAKGLSEKKITTAVFDRSGKKYTGVVATIAQTIRENGIQI
jgi:large subunit ribosomal protein L18